LSNYEVAIAHYNCSDDDQADRSLINKLSTLSFSPSLAERFGDEELNSLPFRDVETLLALRFMRRLPDARNASAGLDASPCSQGGESHKRSISPVETPVL
jgi:hypothetical protein